MRHLAEAQQDGEAAAAALANPKRRITLCVEGNISAGKSSFLQRILKGSVELRDIVEVRDTLMAEGWPGSIERQAQPGRPCA